MLGSYYAPLTIYSQSIDPSNSYTDDSFDDDFLDHQTETPSDNRAVLYARVLIGWQGLSNQINSLAIIALFTWPLASLTQQLIPKAKRIKVDLRRLLVEALYSISAATGLWHLSHIFGQPAWGLWTGLALLIAWIGLHSQVYGEASD